MITDVQDYFDKGCGRCARFDTPDCSTRLWATGLAELRRICAEAGLEESVRWGHPCYRHADRNIVLVNAFRDHFRLTFFNAALLDDPERILEPAGPNGRTADTIRFTDSAQPAQVEPVLRAYLAQAMDHAQAGLRPEKTVTEVPLPDELVQALDADPELAEAFAALTPGRRKSYALNLNGAKKPETRVARIAAFRPKILAGKGALDR